MYKSCSCWSCHVFDALKNTAGLWSHLDQERCDCDISIGFALTFNNLTPPPYPHITSNRILYFLASRHAPLSPHFYFIIHSTHAHAYAHPRQLCDLDCPIVKRGVIKNPARRHVQILLLLECTFF